MAINPDNITTIRVDQLAESGLTLDSKFPHTVGTELTASTIEDLVALVSSTIETSVGVGFLPLAVTDGQQLPSLPEDPSFFLAGAGTYLNINGYPDLICTENLNAIMTVTDHWEIAVEIPIAPLSGTVQSVTGSAVDNTDPLNPVIDLPPSGVQSVSGDTVDNTDPANPVVNVPTLQQVTDVNNELSTSIEVLDNSVSFGQNVLEDPGTTDGVYSYVNFNGGGGFNLTSGDTGTGDISRISGDSQLLTLITKLGLKFKSLGTYFSIFKTTNLTADRTFEMPDNDGTLALISQTITNGVTDKAPSEDAVFDALAKIENFIVQKSGGSYGTHTGTTAETVLLSIDITGGEFVAGDLMSFLTTVNKTGAAGTFQVRYRVGTTGTTADALIATGVNSVASDLTASNQRLRMQFLSGNILAGIRNVSALTTDITTSSAYTLTSLNYSSDWKFTITVQLGNAADTVVLNQYRIGKLKTL